MSEKVIKAAVSAFNEGDATALGKLFGGGLGKGIGASLKSARTGFSDLTYKIEHIAVEGDQVVFSYVAKGTNDGKFEGQAATKKAVTWRGSATATIQGNKIVGLQTREDTLIRGIQLGRKLFLNPSLTGNWSGSASGITVTLQLVQTGNNVTGTAQAFGSSFPVTGSVNYPNVNLKGTMNGLLITFGGAYNPPPNTIPGTLTAMGSSLQVTLKRQ